jgi:RNA polymerase sigma factor (TIGR02999 family)
MAEAEEQDWAAATRLLREVDTGSKEALDSLFGLLYDKLRGMSHRLLAAHVRHETLSTTALVHEAYLKLSRDHGWTARDREHFLSISARAMRQIVVDAARARGATKRGGAVHLVPISDLEQVGVASPEEVLALDRAIAKLARVDPELERLVELRFFAGLSLEEIRDLTGISDRSLKRRFRSARALLVEELGLTPKPPAASKGT